MQPADHKYWLPFRIICCGMIGNIKLISFYYLTQYSGKSLLISKTTIRDYMTLANALILIAFRFTCPKTIG